MLRLHHFSMIIENCAIVFVINYLLIGVRCQILSHLELIGDFFMSKNVNSLNIYGCSGKDVKTTIQFLVRDYKKAQFLVNGKFNETKENWDELQKQNYKIGAFIDLSCDKNTKVFNAMSSGIFFNTSYTWLALCDEYNYISNAVLGPSSDLTLFNTNYTFYHVQRSRPDFPVSLVPIGQWTDNYELELAQVPPVRQLDGATILGSLFLTRNVFNKDKLSLQFQDITYHPGEDISNRFSYAHHLLLSDLFNYSIEFILTDDWGTPQPDGHFTGMLGMIEDCSANFTVGPLQIMPIRLAVGDAVIPIHTFRMPFIFRQPRSLGTYRALSLQLTPWVWTCIALLVVASSLTFTISQSFSTRKVRDGESEIGTSFIQFIGVLAQQGLPIEPYRCSSRLVCLFMLLICTLIAIYYNAATMNALLSATPPSIVTLDDLLESNIPLALVDAPYFKDKRVRPKLLNPKTIAKADQYSSRTFSIDEGLELILKGVAFGGEYFWLFEEIDKSFKESDKCDLSVILPHKPVSVAPYIIKDSPLKELYMQGFLRLKEHGFTSREYLRWFPEKQKCLISQRFLFVKLESVSIALGVYIIGAGSSMIIFLYEVAYMKITTRTRAKKNGKSKGKIMKIQQQINTAITPLDKESIDELVV